MKVPLRNVVKLKLRLSCSLCVSVVKSILTLNYNEELLIRLLPKRAGPPKNREARASV